MRTFLLGAGASVDAGLDSSTGLTKAIAQHLGRGPSHDPTGQLLHAVIGAMIQHDASAGADVFAIPDIERVFTAVTDLKRREQLDVSAFVERWKGSFDSLTGPSGLSQSWGRDFRESLVGETAGEQELRGAFERGVRAITDSEPSALFADLEQRMRLALVQLLKVDPSKVSYLDPMLSTPDLNAIATLNYDLSVETACSTLGLLVDTGFDKWRGGYEWKWRSNADLRLLKLHGSVDYVLHNARPIGGRLSSEHLVHIGNEIGANPALVFGLSSKLRSDGPFLAMLIELDRILADTEWLCIVGYSFRDDHINAAITRWMNSDVASRLSIVDPSIDEWVHGGLSAPRYFSRLLEGARGEGREFGWPSTWKAIRTDLLSKSAALGLAGLQS